MAEIRIPGIRRVLQISLRRRSDIERDVAEEIRLHIELRAEELARLGMSPRDARERAEAEYGDVEASRRELVAVDRRRADHERREEWVMSILDDVRYGARGLMRRPALLAVTTLALAVGIAANTIMFGVVDQLLLRPPAHVVAPEGVKRIWFADNGKFGPNLGSVTTYPAVAALRSAPVFSDVAAYGFRYQWSLGTGPDAKDVAALMVSGNFFRALGVRPQLGRFFVDGEDRAPQGDLVAVVSDRFWRAELNGATDAPGRIIRLQGKLFTVVGVAPVGFSGIDREYIDVWVPVSSMATEIHGPNWHDTANSWWASAIARVRDDVAPELGTEQATALYRAFIRRFPDTGRDSTSRVVFSSIIGTRTPEGFSTESKISLWLTGVSAIVLLIACANVANILIARTVQRRREIAVRLAMGVSRARLVQLLLAEAGIIAGIAVVVALALAVVASRLVQDVLLARIVWSESVLDLRVLGFALAVSVICVLLAGVAPALEALGTNVGESLKVSSHQSTGRQRLRFALMSLQAALSIVLLIGAGLFVRSLRNVVGTDVGIDRDRVFRVTMPLHRFGFDTTQVEDVYRRAVERLSAVPGVTHASVARRTYPMGGASASSFEAPGATAKPDFERGGPYEAIVDEQFFPAVGTTILQGRNFTEAEDRLPTRVAIVNDLLAKGYWPNESPIGKCVKVGGDSACSEVVGVVSQVLQFRLIKDPRALVYVPTAHPYVKARPGAIMVRVSGDVPGTAAAVRREMQKLSGNMPFVSVRSFEELVQPQLQPWRLGATMFTLFGVIALVIASIGLYSVMAFWVSQRTQEIGVRMALGAQRSDVVRLVAWQSTRAVVIGLVLGAAAAAFASRWVAELLYETSPRDPLVYAGAGLVLVLAAVVASIVPARRSAGVDPAVAIRAD